MNFFFLMNVLNVANWNKNKFILDFFYNNEFSLFL